MNIGLIIETGSCVVGGGGGRGVCLHFTSGEVSLPVSLPTGTLLPFFPIKVDNFSLDKNPARSHA
jgi:hypothetical protein